jgi:ribonuclease BN (tRNA processing enzyme)
MKITTIGCWGAYPKAQEATSGYLIQSTDINVLIDCGSGVLSHLQSFISLEELDAVILSHYHTDHMADIYSLQYATMILTQLGKRDKPLHIYAHNEDQEQFETLAYKTYCENHVISANTTLQLGSLCFSFYQNIHPSPCLSMRVNENWGPSIAYTADTEWTDELLKLAENTELLLCESSLYEEQRGKIPGHLTARQAGELAFKTGVKRLVLTHLPHYGDHAQLLKEAKEAFTGSVELAVLGKSWTIENV